MIKYIYFIFLFVVLVLFLVFHFKSIYVEEFHGAVDSGDLDHISELLQEGYDINAPDSLEWYPIHTAIMKRDEKLLKFLLENGANINSQSKQGWTPLHYAVAVTSGYSGARLLSVKYKKNIRNSKNYRYLNKEDWPKSN